MDSLNASSQSNAIDNTVRESSQQCTVMPGSISPELSSRVYNAGTCGCSISANNSDSKRVEEALDKILGTQKPIGTGPPEPSPSGSHRPFVPYGCRTDRGCGTAPRTFLGSPRCKDSSG